MEWRVVESAFAQHEKEMRGFKREWLRDAAVWSLTDRATLASAMPARMVELLASADRLIHAVCNDAELRIGTVFTAHERIALQSVARSGWELESFDTAFSIASERLHEEVDDDIDA